MNLYDKDRDVIALGQFYTDHISAMTREGLHAKSDIAAELAYRDQRIATLEAEKAEYEREKLKREAQEPVAFRWLGPGKGWRAVYAEPPVSRELEARIRELEAEKAERERELQKMTRTCRLSNLVVQDALDRCARIVLELRELRTRMAERERQAPVAWAWDDALGCMHVHCGQRRPEWVDRECSDAKRAETSLRPLYAAPPIPRVEQEPVAWVLFDDIFIALKDMPDDPPNLECMKPLYAHPLALREPTEDECRRIANEFLILGGPDELAGRVMFNAVREVMTK